MKKSLFATLFISFVCLVANDNASAQGNIITLNAQAAIDNKKQFDLSDISNEIEFIPLDDSSEDALIGDPDAIEESTDAFFISDGVDRPVRVFDKSGKFLSTRGRIGRGPGEFLFLGDIAVDSGNSNVYIDVATGGYNIFMYNQDNRMVAASPPISWDNHKIAFYDYHLIVQTYPYVKPDADGKVAFIDIFSSDLRHEGSIRLPHKATNNYFIRGNQILSYNGKELLVKEELDDILYHYRDGTLIPVYKLDMGKYFFSHRMWDRTMESQWNKYYQVFNVFDGDRYMAVTVNNGFFGFRGYLVFDKHNPSGGFMTIGSNGKPGLFIDGIRFTPRYIRDNRLVGYMQALDIVDNTDNITNPELKALAATLREDSNPVIVVAKLKN